MSDTLWTGKNSNKMYEQSGSFTSTVKISLLASSISTECTGISPHNDDEIFLADHQYEKTFKLSGKFTTVVRQSVDHSAYLYSNQGISPDEVNTLVGGDGADLGEVDDEEMYLMSGKITSTIKASLRTGLTWDEPLDVSSDGINSTFCIPAEFILLSGQITTTVKESLTGIRTTTEGIGWDGRDTLSCHYSGDWLMKYSGRFTTTVKDSIVIVAHDGNPEGIESSNFNLRMGIGNFGTITLPMVGLTTMNVIVLPVLEVWAGSQGAWFSLPMISTSGWMVTDNTADLTLPMLSVSSIANPGNNTINLTLPGLTVYSEQILRADGNVVLPMITLFTEASQGSVESISLTMPVLTLSAFSGHVVKLTLPSFSLDAVGQSGIRGLYNKGLPRLQVVGYGTLHQHGNANVRIPLFSLQTNLINGIISISTDIVLPVLTTNFHGFRGENGNISIIFPMIETATNVALNPNGDVSLTLFALKLDAYADVYINRFI